MIFVYLNFNKERTMKKLRFVLPCVLIVAFYSCGGVEEPTNTVHLDQTQLPNPTIIEESSDFAFAPPSPLEIAGFFKQAGLVYDPSNLNPASNKDNYNTKLKKSLNFGVYATDLATCVVNNQIADAQGYLEAIQHLSDEIGMQNIFEQETIEKFKRNIGNSDSIEDILTNIQMSTVEYIELNGKDDLEVIYFAGAWIEGMYLGTLTLTEQDSKNIVQQLASQIEFGNRIAKGLQSVEDQDPEIKFVRQNIDEIVEFYKNCESIKGLSEDDKDLGRIEMTDEELNSISKLIVELRTDMIN